MAPDDPPVVIDLAAYREALAAAREAAAAVDDAAAAAVIDAALDAYAAAREALDALNPNLRLGFDYFHYDPVGIAELAAARAVDAALGIDPDD